MRLFFTAGGLGVWTLLVYAIYWVSDGAIGLGVANTGSIVETGRQVAGNEAGRYLENMNVDEFTQKGLSLLQGIIGPLFAIVWMIGAALLVSIPWLVSRFAGFFNAQRSK
ncbi:hypothetical protein [Phyllobacterium myrsinacearum]|uniref:Uncharacterized protein n=1 Tax=Phyllobacterium myrsinacearum TaxID=28101 RepID=A0A839ELN7_9HYPH|nr:hypothetical protein [Phyllobacterium myrsinacearum]MBA8879125.1 hypothetical protein [Phyllobacterium myrsinacearum]